MGKKFQQDRLMPSIVFGVILGGVGGRLKAGSGPDDPWEAG
jgi:hypothetical protein